MRHSIRRPALLFVASVLLIVSLRVIAEEPTVFELEPEFVYGKNRGPKIGYTPPEVFDPLSDSLYQSGYRDFSPVGVPMELRDVDAMTRVKTMGRIIACADGWFWPFSRTARNNEPPGIEIELLQTIAKKHGWEVSMAWVNMSTRFGPGAPGGAYDRSIKKGVCDLVLGLTETGDDHHMAPNHLVFTRSFMSTGFVLVTQGSAKSAKSLDDIKSMNLKIGVPAYSPMSEYAEAHEIPHSNFFQNYQVIDALLRREVDAAMIWSGAISQARLKHPEAEFVMVKDYVPPLEMRWNSVWVIKEKEVEFKKFIDDAFVEMLKNGEIKRIAERYGMPFFPPLEK